MGSITVSLAVAMVAASGIADGMLPCLPEGTPDGTIVQVAGIQGKAVVSPKGDGSVRVTAMVLGGEATFRTLIRGFRDRLGLPVFIRPDPPLAGWSSADVTVTYLPRKPDAVWVDWICPAM